MGESLRDAVRRKQLTTYGQTLSTRDLILEESRTRQQPVVYRKGIEQKKKRFGVRLRQLRSSLFPTRAKDNGEPLEQTHATSTEITSFLNNHTDGDDFHF